MFGLEILDIVIGLMFVYLLLSLLATALNEYVAALLNLRGKELARGIGRLLDDAGQQDAVKKALAGLGPRATTAADRLTEQFYNHRLIRPLATRRGWLTGRIVPWPLSRLFPDLGKDPRLPSYIPARTFAMALLDVLGYQEPAATDPIDRMQPGQGADAQRTGLVEMMEILKRESPLDVGQLEGLLEGTAVPDALKPRLLEALTGAQNRLQHLHDSVEVWFNNAMDRASGAYKRTTQGWLFVLGLFIAAFSNADTIEMWRRLAGNDELRAAMAQRAVQRLPALEPGVRGAAPAAGEAGSPAAADTAGADTAAVAAATAAADPRAREKARAESAWKEYQAAKSELDSMELKLGWTTEQLREAGLLKPGTDAPDWFPFDRGGFWLKLLGLLLTAVAISLGAPFWFDLLNKVISIRAAGRSPEERPKPPEGAPKRPAEHTPK